MSKNERQLGDKLLPKITAAVMQAVLSTKLQLTGHDVTVRTVAGQRLIDRMGHEVADHIEPFITAALEHSPDMHPTVREYLQRTASGENQLQAIAGNFALGAAGSVLGTVISNELAPLGYAIVGDNPHLRLDPQTAALLMTKGIFSRGDMLNEGAASGLNSVRMDSLESAAQAVPDSSTIGQLVNRGFMDLQNAEFWLHRGGYGPSLHRALLELRQQILTPADAALAVLKGIIDLTTGVDVARKNGMTDADFDILVANTGEPPGPQQLGEALRRGFIDRDTFAHGIRQSRVRDEWINTLLALRYQPLNTADAVNAHVEGYVDDATVKKIADENGLEPEQYKILIEAAGDPLSFTEMMTLWRRGKATKTDVEEALRRSRLKNNYIPFAVELKDSPMTVADAVEASVQGYLTYDEAKAIALMDGLREQDFDPLWKTAGSPASRTEMIELWQRGEVTQKQVENALRQSRLKDVYIPDVLKLKRRLPALYEVRALLANGSFSAEQGTTLLLEQGYDRSVVEAIVKTAVAGVVKPHKALTLGMYTELYREGAVTEQEFKHELAAIGYNEVEQNLIAEIEDNKLALTQRNAVISKIRTEYLNHKVTEAQAQHVLNEIRLHSDMVDRLITDWNLIRETKSRTLSEAQIVDAWFTQLFDPASAGANTVQALKRLTELGYSEYDSVKLLEIKNKGPLK
jgi:hypothetical protein